MNYVHQLMTNIPTNGDAVTSLLSLEGVSTELVDLFGKTVIMGLNCIVVIKIPAKLLQKFQGWKNYCKRNLPGIVVVVGGFTTAVLLVVLLEMPGRTKEIMTINTIKLTRITCWAVWNGWRRPFISWTQIRYIHCTTVKLPIWRNCEIFTRLYTHFLSLNKRNYQ